MSIELREITESNRTAVESLRVSAAQERFIDSVAESISEAESSPEAQPWYRAI
jgi:diamine N-acetyltransferase